MVKKTVVNDLMLRDEKNGERIKEREVQKFRIRISGEKNCREEEYDIFRD
jgi:hypothetical protein